jgi:hypothetical protein
MKKYRILASPDLLQVNWNETDHLNENEARYSVDYQWAIIEYKEEQTNPDWDMFTADEIINYINIHYNEWNPDTTVEPWLSYPNNTEPI